MIAGADDEQPFVTGTREGLPTNQELREAENLVPRLVILRMGYEGRD